MQNKNNRPIYIEEARENNLKSISLSIPRHHFTVVTGVSGSGKSSLVFDTLYKEGQRRYLTSFSSYARQFMQKLSRPDVAFIDNLSPAIAISQKTAVNNPRSTVGTMTELYDYLRLLFARLGKTTADISPVKTERRLFSFNSPYGACSACNGLGVEDKISPDLLVADKNKSLKDRALVITAPNGYIIYSQVTMDVLNRVCEAHGFHVGIPWKDLTPEQKNIILYGSDRIKIPFGKHTLESRMKWSGITAKPREEGYYKGIIPVMEEILKRDRNKNILRFVTSVQCSSCGGKRLRPEALAVTFHDKTIADYASMTIEELYNDVKNMSFGDNEKAIAEPIRESILKRAEILLQLQTGYLALSRESTTLSSGEARRIRLSTQVGSGLRGILYTFDEPSVGLHQHDNEQLLKTIQDLRDNGNTIITVEHDTETMKHADRLIDLGIGSGKQGGEVMFNLDTRELFQYASKQQKDIPDTLTKSHTFAFLSGNENIEIPEKRRTGNGAMLKISNASHFNLKNIDVDFRLAAFNVVCGVSGAGKSTLVKRIVAAHLKQKLHATNTNTGRHKQIGVYIEDEKQELKSFIDKIIEIDQSPIGRTPRSNPATYTKLFNHIRSLFAALPESKARQWNKGRFSFNVKGGRCEKCQGAGVIQVGMHFLGDVDIQCDHCGGKRFNEQTLQIKYKGKNIYDVLEMSINEAVAFFEDKKKIRRFLDTMQKLGLGYLKLGQSATTLSGGEAQRIKLAAELSRPYTGKTLYIFDEPTTGLHSFDIKILLASFQELVDKGNTIIAIEHNPDFIKTCDHIVDLGPGSGKKGGELVVSGTPEKVAQCPDSLTGKALQGILHPENQALADIKQWRKPDIAVKDIEFKGITTNNLKNVDVTIPYNKITVITGVSGSGKSSLAFDTIFAEGQKRYAETFSTYLRTMLGGGAKADFAECTGITPAIAISQKTVSHNPRSTVGTITGIYDYLRLLYSRVGNLSDNEQFPASMFSFNNEQGACPYCEGLGEITVCAVEKLVSEPEKSLLDGALNGSKTGKFYGDPFGQYAATLRAVGEYFGIDYSKPYSELSGDARQKAMFGTGDKEYEVNWKFKRKNREGEHHFTGTWLGFARLVNDEYKRKHADKRGDAMLKIMKQEKCPKCVGKRLNDKALSVKFAGFSIAELCAQPVNELIDLFHHIEKNTNHFSISDNQKLISRQIRAEIDKILKAIRNVGLPYLTLNRRSSSLSGGEAQRIRLASQLGEGLTGVLYVLDEPTIGLHQNDTDRLISTLKYLNKQGNTIIIVEHDEAMIKAADHIIDLGPAAGKQGGEIVAQGNVQEIMQNPNSVTGKYLKEKSKTPVKTKRTPKAGFITVRKASANNLKNIDVKFPKGLITAITGVSGSGKSSLLFDVLNESARQKRLHYCEAIEGLTDYQQIVPIDSKPIGASSVSAVATYTGVFDLIRDVFAKTLPAKEKSLKKADFSFQSKKSACTNCNGLGKVKISMDFLADITMPCEECKGKRYKKYILDCYYQEKNIADVLSMSVAEAVSFFSSHKKIKAILDMLCQTGLGYLQLGQATGTLSGGELQRLKLTKEVISNTRENNVYLLDEPTIGLHFDDIEKLTDLFDKLTAQGHTVIVIEHHQMVMEYADWLIELGPEGGAKGGEVLSQG